MTKMAITTSQAITRDFVESNFCSAVSGLQITDDYRERVKEFAGPLATQVGAIFKGRSDIAYLLCDRIRRQVWNCALSNLNILEQWEKDQNFSEAFFADLCQTKSVELIKRIYGSNPPGFIKVLGHLGDVAQVASTYRNLHSLCDEDPNFAQKLGMKGELSASAIAFLVKLPVPLRHPQLAQLITENQHETAFLDFVAASESLPPQEREEMFKQTIRASKSYGLFTRHVQKLCSQFPFPSPKLEDPEKIRHIANETELKLAGEYFGNCLSVMTEPAHRGDLQFYEWLGEDQGVFSIKQVSGEWMIDQIDFLGGTQDRHWTMVTEFVLSNLGYPVERPQKSLLEATRALVRETTWTLDDDVFG